MNRRHFLKTTSATLAVAPAYGEKAASASIDSFSRPDSLGHGTEWESLNPGYWQIKDGALRRRLKNVGDRARRTGFPYHSETHGKKKMETDYDPSLPHGILWRREWKLTGNYQIRIKGTYHADAPAIPEEDNPEWKMHQVGYSQIGIAIGGRSLFEGYDKSRKATLIGYQNDGYHAVLKAPTNKKKKGQVTKKSKIPILKPGDSFILTLEVSGPENGFATIVSTFNSGGEISTLTLEKISRYQTSGFFGVATRGLIDFEISEFSLDPERNKPLAVGHAECYACYPLGDTLKKVDSKWQVKFVGVFASDGRKAEIRVSDSPEPSGGWQKVPVAGTAKIVSNDFRRNTAIIITTLPESPGDATLYYTIWKDAVNVTADPRIGSDACGPGTGLVGDVPSSGSYVGRLPQLKAPYKLCGLSCHAITSGLQQRTEQGFKILGGGDDWQFRDQPSVESYKHLEAYKFQIMVWEDDVWYMELVLYPPSTDDAYKVIANSIFGPTSRWQMMRHWNVINPGDHDYGMDDVKGPEQIAIRKHDVLGQDPSYMRRNFQIVHHLVTGAEEVDPLANPKKWRAWKMPRRDFTLTIVDARLWRSSQDTNMWKDWGWGHLENAYDRTDPTRALLGEEQFAWLQQLIRTDSSPLICLTGLNGLHTIWTGAKGGQTVFDQRDRVAADYAGWVKAGADRLIQLLSERDGVVTVYGDVHNGSIIKNTDYNLIECSFGPIGRSGGRAVIPGFGPSMKDFDGRPLDVYCLYHREHATPDLKKQKKDDPFYWNFLEMEFDTVPADPKIELRVRNLIDAPDEKPRGGGSLFQTASQSGQSATCKLPAVKTLPNADLRLVHTDGRPIRGTRSRSDGSLPLKALPNIPPKTAFILTAFNGKESHSQTVTTL